MSRLCLVSWCKQTTTRIVVQCMALISQLFLSYFDAIGGIFFYSVLKKNSKCGLFHEAQPIWKNESTSLNLFLCPLLWWRFINYPTCHGNWKIWNTNRVLCAQVDETPGEGPQVGYDYEEAGWRKWPRKAGWKCEMVGTVGSQAKSAKTST